jgi:ferrous iron transport protein B
VLLHPVLGFAIFLGMMTVVFQALFTWSGPGIDLIEGAFGWLAASAEAVLPAGFARDLLTEGVITGVGSVVVFLPQILLLFLFIGLLEDSGYMARVAFLMDRVMRSAGLNGRAFVPMMSSFACAIPAILATRTMERQRDRFLTMMVIPLMTCSARLPVYTLIIGALFPVEDWLGLPLQGLLMAAMYLFSTLIALLAAAVLSRTLFTGPSVPLLLELPPYRRPQLGAVLRMMWQRSALFLKEAGGVILVCTIGLWLLLSFPASTPGSAERMEARAQAEASLSGEALAAAQSDLDNQESAEQLQNSYAGRLGRAIEPVIEPLGFDWKIGVGLIGAFAAREVFVSTMGLVYGLSEDVDKETATLREKIRTARRDDGSLVYTPLAGLSLLVFIALACQCMSTLAAVRRETATYRWPLFMFVYMTALAWGASFVVFQGGRLLGFS